MKPTLFLGATRFQSLQADSSISYLSLGIVCGYSSETRWRHRIELAQAFDAMTARAKRIYLPNRCHVAMRLFSNRSQMTPKCGKKKKVAQERHITKQITTHKAFVYFKIL